MEDVLKYLFDHITRQIKAADTIPGLIASAFIGLDLIERATTVIAQDAPEEVHGAYQTALAEATDAWWALTDAPSLAWPNSFRNDTDVRQLSQSISALVLVVAEAILTAASKTTDPADRVACLRAAHHAGHVHAALGGRQ